MNKWAKLFEVNGEQVLFFIEADETRDDRCLHQLIMIDEYTVDAIIKGLNPNDAQLALNSIDQETAKLFLEKIKEVINPLNIPPIETTDDME